MKNVLFFAFVFGASVLGCVGFQIAPSADVVELRSRPVQPVTLNDCLEVGGGRVLTCHSACSSQATHTHAYALSTRTRRYKHTLMNFSRPLTNKHRNGALLSACRRTTCGTATGARTTSRPVSS
jgi:hypothetical protein